MRILGYSHNFHPTVGGIATYCDELCTALAAAGEDITLLAPSPPSGRVFSYPVLEMPAELAHDRITLHGYFRAARDLRRAVAVVCPDVLWCCSLDALYTLALTSVETALAVTVHGSEISGNFGYLNPAGKIRAMLVTQALVKADRIVAVSRYTEKMILHHLPQLAERIDVVHNGIAPPFTDDEAAPRQSGRMPAAGATLLSVGRLVEFKGFHLFPRILQQLVRLIPSIRWLIAGDGNYRAAIAREVEQRGLQQHVQFCGWVDQETLAGFYRHADMLVHPAVTDSAGRDESFGLILIEAMMNGCPVAVSGAGGTSEIIQDGQSGIVFNPRNPGHAADRIAGFLRDREGLEKIAASGRQLALERFSVARCMEKTLENLLWATQEKRSR